MTQFPQDFGLSNCCYYMLKGDDIMLD